MFDIVRKDELWDALSAGWRKELGGTQVFHLKTIQDLAVFGRLRHAKGLDIAEIGGGNSRLLRWLSRHNQCVNVEKFEGADGGPAREVKIRGVSNVHAFLGEYDKRLKPDSFDAVFSISVVEHVPTDALEDFLEDGLRILRPGGLWLHAIDLYLRDTVDAHLIRRFDIYRSWATAGGRLASEGKILEGPPRFSCDMATNPDDIMHEWGKVAPKLIPLRQKAQSVSVIVAGRKQ